jgi:hypothetical protein
MGANNYYGTGAFRYKLSSEEATRYQQEAGAHKWFTAPTGTAGNAITFTQAMTLTETGDLRVGTTSALFAARLSVQSPVATNGAGFITTHNVANQYTAIACGRSGNNGNVAEWWYDTSTQVGTISVTASSTAYNTSSDYRLKNTIAPMTGALDKVALLKPCTYKWNADGSNGQGFIAHELQAVIPDAVTGEKDAVDAEGKPKYQGIDTSFLVATLTAAIQELKAEFDAYKASHP